MKTTNNVQQAILKSLAVVVSLVLISFTVSAQGFWETLLENNTFNEIALAMVENTSESDMNSEASAETEADALAYYLEEEAEEELVLEDWMTNEESFETTITFETELEEQLEVEEWMTDEAYFTGSAFEVETEETLEVENWMVDDKNFDTDSTDNEVVKKGNYIIGRNFVYLNVDDKEKELKLEPWMVNDKVWVN